jgi:HSP20 family protein
MPSFWRNPMDRFFGNDFSDLWSGEMLETMPAINIKEENDNYKLELAAPGLKKEDFNISLDGNVLTISSEKESENKDEKDNYSRREYNYSSFSRSLTLPENSDGAQVSAKYADGILHLTVPKKKNSEQKNGQKIKVE